MSETGFRQRVYDHRLRDLVFRTGDISIALDCGVPRSTAAGWLARPSRNVVSIDVLDKGITELQAEVLKLRRRVRVLAAVVGLLVTVNRATGRSLDRVASIDSAARARILAAADRARKVLPARSVLKILGVSHARLSAWRRVRNACDLEGHPTCPASRPNRLTLDEIQVMEWMVTDIRFRHVPTSRLAILAQRMGKVFTSPSTWYRLARERQWRRPRWRQHPKTPRTGVRAVKPDEVWHVDTSIVRLVDGSKVWLHAVIDNFSRRILAWRVADHFAVGNAVAALREAVEGAVSADEPSCLVADGGVENFNPGVDGMIEAGLLCRVRALADVRFSNSMIGVTR